MDIWPGPITPLLFSIVLIVECIHLFLGYLKKLWMYDRMFRHIRCFKWVYCHVYNCHIPNLHFLNDYCNTYTRYIYLCVADSRKSYHKTCISQTRRAEIVFSYELKWSKNFHVEKIIYRYSTLLFESQSMAVLLMSGWRSLETFGTNKYDAECW